MTTNESNCQLSQQVRQYLVLSRGPYKASTTVLKNCNMTIIAQLCKMIITIQLDHMTNR